MGRPIRFGLLCCSRAVWFNVSGLSEGSLLKVGLTGGIATGKSLVGAMFAELGVHTIDADEIAHDLMRPSEKVYDEVVRRFGREILNPDGSVNRTRLAELAFDQKRPRIYELNGIVHPAVIERQEQWMEEIRRREPDAIVMLEAALLLEAGLRRRFDRVIVVSCRPPQRIERWEKRLHVDAETARREVMRRMMAQAPDEAKIQAADYVIDNSGDIEQTRKQVEKIHEALLSQAQAKTA
jgi:dephospho-CoA kinase